VEITVKGIKALERQLDPKLLRMSLRRSLDRTVTTAVKEASMAVRSVYNIKASRLKSYITVRKATVEDLEARITLRSKPIPLIEFGGSKYIAKRKGRKVYYGASAKVLKKERKKRYKGAFIATMGSHTGIYRRKGRGRFPVRELTVISATTMFRKYGVDKIEDVFERVFLERVMREYRYQIEKRGGK